MAKNRTLYILFVLACVAFSAAYQSRASAVLLTAALTYPVIALVLTTISLFTVSADFAEARAVHEKNETFEVPVLIRNNFIFPYAPAELHCTIPDADTGLFMKKQLYVAVAPLKRMRIFVPCMHRYRGSYIATISKVSVFDPLKIIRLTRKLDSRMQFVFLPRKISLEELGFVFGGDRGTLPENRPGADKEDFSHVREYAMGDILQLIHWKLTAKHDDMMVKQYDTTGDRRCVILCNFSQDGAAASSVMRRSDAVIETAVAVAMSASRAGVKAFADTGAVSGLTCDIADAGSFNRFYDMMSVLPPNFETTEFTELIRKYSVFDAAATFLITPVVNEEIFAAAEAAASRLVGTLVLIYINCKGRSDYAGRDQNSRFVFAEVCGEMEENLPAAAEQILTDYMRLH